MKTVYKRVGGKIVIVKPLIVKGSLYSKLHKSFYDKDGIRKTEVKIKKEFFNIKRHR